MQEKFKELTKNLYLRDTILEEIRIFNSEIYELCVELLFNIKHRKVKIIFNDVSEFQFYRNNLNFSYVIEDYKFFITNDNIIYISLDPYLDDNEIDDKDCEFIKSKDFSVEWIS